MAFKTLKWHKPKKKLVDYNIIIFIFTLSLYLCYLYIFIFMRGNIGNIRFSEALVK